MSGNTIEIRCKVELRADASRQSPGRLAGVLLTYGEQAADRPERFLPGALHWPDAGVMLREQHNRAAPIVRFVPTEHRGAILINAQLPDTSRGRDAAVGVREGVYGGLSVEFLAERESWTGNLREIARALLTGAGLVDDASYDGSTVEVRHRAPGIDLAELLLWL